MAKQLYSNAQCYFAAKLPAMSKFLQDPHKTETVLDSNGDKPNSQAGSRTGSFGAPEEASIAATSGTRQNSAFQLIIHPNEDKKLNKFAILRVAKKTVYILLIVLLVGGLAAMTSLYISQKSKSSQVRDSNLGHPTKATKSEANKNNAATTKSPRKKPTLPPCVPVIDARPIPHVPPEITELTKKLNVEIEGFQKMYKVKAASVAFSYRGNIWWSKHVGSMNFENSESSLPNNDTPYPVASVTKVLTTIMMQKLFEEDKITNLDDPVNKYLPEFSVKNPFNKEKVTLRQLSCMMSGLPREAPCFPPEKLDYCPFNASEMWPKIANISLIMPPDKNPSYSNLGFSVLGSALEKIAGVKYMDWVTNNIIKPLGMENSGFDLVANANKFPVSTNADGSKARIINWGWQIPSGGLYSSINDLNKLAKMLFELMNDTTVLHRRTARKMFKPIFLYNSGHGTGYSFEILNSKVFDVMKHHSHSNLEHLIYAKSGACFGYGAWIALVPELKFAAFSLVAHAGKEAAPGLFLTSPLRAMKPLEDVLLKRLPKYVLPPSENTYVGTYKLVQYWPLVTDFLRIYKKGDVLYMEIQWLKVPLSYVSPLVLVTGHFGMSSMRRCEDFFLSMGLSYMKCFFKKPSKPGGQSPSFIVKGITTYGHAEFKRIP
eukprot:gene3697-4217_t